MLTEKLTVRLAPGQVQVLDELKTKLGCSYSLLARVIIGDWITRNEQILQDIIDGKREFNKNWKYEDAYNSETTEETEDYLS